MLQVFVEDVWNPMSTTQTKRLSGLLQHLVDEYPTVHMDSKNVQGGFHDQADDGWILDSHPKHLKGDVKAPFMLYTRLG
jgi:hypothetical protein